MMKARARKFYSSIKQALIMTNLIVIILALIPFAINIAYYNSVVSEYQKIVQNVDNANSLSSVIREDLNNVAWNLVSGKSSPQSGEHTTLITHINDGLDTLSENASSESNRNLIEVAHRTLGTIEGYVNQIIENINTNESVADNEIMLDNIRSVGDLLYEVIQDFNASEIELAAQKNAALQRTTFALNIIQIGLFTTAIIFIFINNNTLQNRINTPILRMQTMAGKIAQGNFKIRVESPEIDELNDLADSLNTMSGKIDDLLQANTEKQQHLRKAELQILQAQISPHFLYNTLDTIVALAESGQVEDVVTTTIALSNFHRTSLSKGQDWITVSKEISQIESYLTIQKMRYGLLLNYTIDIAENIMDKPILKILLQPLVENAIYHGIKNSRRSGSIDIKGSLENNCLLFVVKNSAPGMDETTLENLQKNLDNQLDDPSMLDKPGYGLYNVHRRIILYYNTTEGLKIESGESSGTIVTLRLPIEKAGENKDV